MKAPAHFQHLCSKCEIAFRTEELLNTLVIYLFTFQDEYLSRKERQKKNDEIRPEVERLRGELQTLKAKKVRLQEQVERLKREARDTQKTEKTNKTQKKDNTSSKRKWALSSLKEDHDICKFVTSEAVRLPVKERVDGFWKYINYVFYTVCLPVSFVTSQELK